MSATWPVRIERDEVLLRPLRLRDASAWTELRAANVAWLRPWDATSPDGRLVPVAFSAMLRSLAAQARAGTALPLAVVWRGRLAGQVTVAGIEGGSMRSASIGYWLDGRLAGRGIMPRAVAMVLDHCFQVVRLHRLEINIRPENAASRRVVEKLGLRCEGTRVGYLHIDGAWRDHLSYAITAPEAADGLWRRLEVPLQPAPPVRTPPAARG